MAAAGVASGARTREGRAQLEASVGKHGGWVPNYTVGGPHHHRVPHKDKGGFTEIAERPEWKHIPNHGTRTDLLAARRAAKHPDLSFDIDGDGGIGPTDYFMSKRFCQTQDHRLSSAERGEVVKALEDGYLDKFSFGHEAAGTNRPFPVKQQRGKIITVDNVQDLADVYPPHPISSVQPRFETERDMKLHRLMEARHKGHMLNDAYEAENPRFAQQPAVSQENMVATPRFTNIAERREAFRQDARASAGLDAIDTVVNPDREHQTIGLGHRDAPEFATRSELLETRRARRRETLERTRTIAEPNYIPLCARHTIHDHQQHEMRRAPMDAMTLTKLKQQRRLENIETNMAAFPPHEDTVPRFSEQDKPWWTLRESYVSEPQACASGSVQKPSEQVAGKVTDIVHVPKYRESPTSGARRAQVSPREAEAPHAHTELGQTVLEQLGTEYGRDIPQNKHQTRIFDGFVDGVKQAAAYSTDSEPLHNFSSFQSIREGAALEVSEQQRRKAHEDHKRARAWRQFTDTGQVSDDLGGVSTNLARVSEVTAGGGPTANMSGAGSRSSSRPHAGRVTVVSPATRPVVIVRNPRGDDPPMTERLDRVAAEPDMAGAIMRNDTETPHSAREVASSMSPVGMNQGPPSFSGGHAKVIAPDATAVGGAATPRGTVNMAVRASGFQWLDQHRLERPAMEEFSVAESAKPSAQGSRHIFAHDSTSRRSSLKRSKALSKGPSVIA